jgi:hypothetical protein
MPANVNMMSERIGSVLVVLHTAATPSEAEWKALFPLLPGTRCLCMFTDGGGPNAAQRKTGLAAGLNALPVSVVTSSSLARGMVTAFSWAGMRVRAFAPSETDKAFAFLELTELERESTWLAFSRLRRELAHTGLERFSPTA